MPGEVMVELPCPADASERVRGVVAEFNRRAMRIDAAGLPRLLGGDEVRDEEFVRLEKLYGAADALSLEAARAYRHALVLLAVAGTVLTVAFLLYDEAELLWMVWLVGAMLACELVLRRVARKSRSHERYVGYRALAECLRVQAMLHHAGSTLAVDDLLTWPQRDDMPWLAAVMGELRARKPGERHDSRSCWVGGQRAYHERAAVRSRQALERSERIVQLATAASVVLYAGALVFELLCGGLMGDSLVEVQAVDTWRAVLKIALGGLSAMTLFVSGYYGNLSLPRVVDDHERLSRFYAEADAWLDEQGQTDALLARIAREELIENGNWCSYQRDNAPDVNL